MDAGKTSAAIRNFYRLGYGRRGEDITKFFAYWVAFCMHYMEDTSQMFDSGDRPRILKYVEQNIDTLNSLDLFDQVEEFKRETVKDLRPSSEKQQKENEEWFYNPDRVFLKLTDEKSEDTDRIAALLISIYQVRCNLFHGHKSILGDEEWRDSLLLEESCKILGKILDYRFPDVAIIEERKEKRRKR